MKMITHVPFDLKFPRLGFNSTDSLIHMVNFFFKSLSFREYPFSMALMRKKRSLEFSANHDMR